MVAGHEGWTPELWDQPPDVPNGIIGNAGSVLKANNESSVTGMAFQVYAYEDSRGMMGIRRHAFCNARSGAAYAAIKKGTVPWQNGLDALTQCRRQLGPFRLRRIVHLGQTNDTATKADWMAAMQEDYDNAQADYRPLTGLNEDIRHFYVQIPILNVLGTGHGTQDALIELHAQAMASPLNRRMELLGTEFQFRHGDNLHLAAGAKCETGAFWGQSLAELLYEGNNGVFWMTGATVSALNTITVTTNALSPLVLGSNINGDPGNYGITVDDKSGVAWPGQPGYVAPVEKAVSSVAVSGTSIVIGCTGAVAGWRVNAGRKFTNFTGTGPGGRHLIRDSRGTAMAMDPTRGLPMWMMACERDVT
jgi:hypothetical protein